MYKRGQKSLDIFILKHTVVNIILILILGLIKYHK